MNELVTLKSPLSVNFEVTPVCDLSCKFCFNAEMGCSSAEHPSLDQVVAILKELARAEVFEVRLFGGEFFTYPDWARVIEIADSMDFFLSFVSNGTHIDEKVVRKMREHRIKNGAISLHGPKSVCENITQVPGSFEATIHGIRSCLEGGLNISILYTLTKENLPFMFETCKWLKTNSIDIDEINAGRLMPYGKARSDWEKNKLLFDDYLNAFSQMERIREELGILANLGDAFPLCLLPKKYHGFVVGCWQGTGFGHIDYMGNVRSCSIAKGSYGNILETPLTEIWTKKLAHFRSLKWLPEKCRKCDNFCGGGCSASQYGGGMYAADEFIA